MSIEFLSPEETHLLVPLIAEFYAEGNILGTFNPEHAVMTVGAHLTAGSGFVLYQGKPLLGAICGFIYPDIGTGETCCTEYFWYVRQKARGGSLGIRLFRAYEEEGKRRGAKRILMSHICTTEERDRTMANIYQSNGYRLKEQSFAKEL